MKTVLVVDDEPLIRWSLAEGLKRDFDVRAAGSAEEALRLMESVRVDAVITDLRMPGVSGVELAAEVLKRSPMTCVIALTAYAFDPIVKHLKSLGVREVLSKPFEIAQIRKLLQTEAGAIPA